jgi:16S rRNA (adenine1518-N6/adenine1519-N6)-dimethyltransferase
MRARSDGRRSSAGRTSTERGSRPRARRRFGQHFLEPAWAQKVVDAIDPRRDQTFLEIGPGTGAITRLLAARARAVVACEVDRDLARLLREAAIPGVLVQEADFLGVRPGDLRAALSSADPASTAYRVAGNLPYNVASPILFRLIDFARSGLPIVDATVMLQREVADRLLAAPGTGEYGLLTVLVRHRASVTRLLNLPPGAFRPAPKVQSTVVRLEFHEASPVVVDESILAGVTSAVFTRRRKTIANALLAYGGVTSATATRALAAAGIDPARRPETLTIGEFGQLADAVARQSM